MIGKILPAQSDFAGTVRYVVDRPGVERLFCGSLVASRAADLVEEGRYWERAAMTRRKKLGFHAVLALHPSEKLTTWEWSEIAERYMGELGYERAPWFGVLHTDTDHQHVHIVGLRIRCSDRKYVPDSFDWVRSRRILDAIERDYELRPGAPQGRAERRTPTTGEVRQAARDGKDLERLPRARLWDAIDAVLEEKPPTVAHYARALLWKGVRVVPNVAKSTDKVSGLRYVHLDSGQSYRASQLGTDAQLPALAERGVEIGDVDLLRGARAHDAALDGRELTPSDHKHYAAWNAFRAATSRARRDVQRRLEAVLGKAGEGGRSATEFVHRVVQAGIDVRPNLVREGKRLRGFHFEWHGHTFRSSELDRRWMNGVKYDSQRDFQSLFELAEPAASIEAERPEVGPSGTRRRERVPTRPLAGAGGQPRATRTGPDRAAAHVGLSSRLRAKRGALRAQSTSKGPDVDD